MENGTYRVQLNLIGTIEPPVDPSKYSNRLAVFLPEGAVIHKFSTEPATRYIDMIVDIPAAGDVIDALQILWRAIEHVSINVRTEHNMDPLGPMPWVREVRIVHA